MSFPGTVLTCSPSMSIVSHWFRREWSGDSEHCKPVIPNGPRLSDRQGKRILPMGPVRDAIDSRNTVPVVSRKHQTIN